MSVYSTETITRSYAIDKLESLLKKLTNEELAEVMFDLIGVDELHNYIIDDDEPCQYCGGGND